MKRSAGRRAGRRCLARSAGRRAGRRCLALVSGLQLPLFSTNRTYQKPYRNNHHT